MTAAACAHDWVVIPNATDGGGSITDTGADGDAEAGCNVSRTCVPEELVKDIADARRFVVTDDAVIWTDAFNNYVGTQPLDGGARLTEPLLAAFGIATDGTSVYAGGNSELRRLPVDGGAQIGYGCGVRSVSVQGETIFWVTSNPACSSLRTVPRTAKQPNESVELLSYVDSGVLPTEIAATPSLLAVVLRKTNGSAEFQITFLPPDAGPPLRTFTKLDAPAGLVATPDGVFSANTGVAESGKIAGDSGAIVEYRTTGDPRVVASKLSHPADLAQDGDFLYFVNAGTPPSFRDGTVERIRTDGTGRETLVAGQWNPRQIRVHGAYVYWMNQADTEDDTTKNGSISRVLK